MDNSIVSNFIKGAIIRLGSELSVSYVPENTFGTPSSITGIFKVARIIITKSGKYYFTLADQDNQARTIVADSSQINEIDGMTAERIIKAFSLAEDGTKKPRKRRKKCEMLGTV